VDFSQTVIEFWLVTYFELVICSVIGCYYIQFSDEFNTADWIAYGLTLCVLVSVFYFIGFVLWFDIFKAGKLVEAKNEVFLLKHLNTLVVQNANVESTMGNNYDLEELEAQFDFKENYMSQLQLQTYAKITK